MTIRFDWLRVAARARDWSRWRACGGVARARREVEGEVEGEGEGEVEGQGQGEGEG